MLNVDTACWLFITLWYQILTPSVMYLLPCDTNSLHGVLIVCYVIISTSGRINVLCRSNPCVGWYYGYNIWSNASGGINLIPGSNFCDNFRYITWMRMNYSVWNWCLSFTSNRKTFTIIKVLKRCLVRYGPSPRISCFLERGRSGVRHCQACVAQKQKWFCIKRYSFKICNLPKAKIPIGWRPPDLS